MSDANVIIKQLTDKEGALVSPFTHAHGVYLSGGTRLDYELTRIDAISASTTSTLERYKYELNQQMSSFSAATNTKIAALSAATDTKILLLSGETTSKINSLSGETGEMSELLYEVYDGVYPIQASMTFTPNASANPTSQSIAMRSYEKQRESTNYKTILTLTRSVNGGAATAIYTSSAEEGSASVSNLAIQGNTELYRLTAAKTGRNPGTSSVTRYVCAYGADVADFSDAVFNRATKVLSSTKSFNPTVSTNENYVWLFCPLQISKIMCNGQAFSYRYEREYNVTSGSYRGRYYVYRSNMKLANTSWYLEIS